MPDNESLDIARNTRGNIVGNCSSGHSQQDPSASQLRDSEGVVERLRQQQQISHEEFHCLVTGQASKWYWQLLEDREGVSTYNYLALKVELLNQFKTADSDYELTREIIERKQHQSDSFEDYYAEIHDLTFRW
uniref:Retrotransposon gag domain-containing protein n=1 Tax=Glossina palpalis gambiensis TaxID=67801 RepID=A0A1B0BXH7_9MUSC